MDSMEVMKELECHRGIEESRPLEVEFGKPGAIHSLQECSAVAFPSSLDHCPA